MSSPRCVPFFDYSRAFAAEEKQILDVTARIIRRGAFILQQELVDFERAIGDYVGAKHVVGVGSATDAIYMLARAIGLGPGDEVIFCTHTMLATAAGVQATGATPVPCETGWDHEMDPASAESLVTPKTKAVIPTQLNGRCADMDAIQALCGKHGLLLIEDSAQALGATFKGRCAGTFGLGGVFSFYPAKTLGCLGDGGCVVTNDDEVARKVRLYRDFGRNADQDVECWALNSRLDNLQAAILHCRFARYGQFLQRRRQIAGIYRERLTRLEQLVLPPGPDGDPGRYDIFQNYEIEAQRRDELRAFLKDRGVGTLIQWGGKAVHEYPKLGFTRPLPYTEDLFTRMLMLPMNHMLEDDDVQYVCDCVQEFYR
jgi:dTDP-4-amino-4,6-dideoxygalactose transaminase